MVDKIYTGTIKDTMFAPIKGHKSKKININGSDVDVDEKIVELVECLNRFGIKTIYSCEGVKGTYARIKISSDNVQRDVVGGKEKYDLIFPSPSDWEMPGLGGGE